MLCTNEGMAHYKIWHPVNGEIQGDGNLIPFPSADETQQSPASRDNTGVEQENADEQYVDRFDHSLSE